MKLTILAISKNWHIKELLKAAKKAHIETNVVDFKTLYEAKKYKNWGDVVIWRSCSLDSQLERPLFYKYISDKSLIINQGQLKHPNLSQKQSQQEIISYYVERTNEKEINTIQTFRFKEVDDLKRYVKKKILKFPFIEKPDFGAEGRGVRLIKKYSDIRNTKNVIYQNFIKNSGDYRILCLGGKVVGIMKRTSKKGDFRNNISQGGFSEHITDPKLVEKLSSYALKIVSILNFTFCGVDIIYDEIKKKYIFLEVNSCPGWDGFQECTKIRVADHVIAYCIEYYKRNTKTFYDVIKDYYLNNIDSLAAKKYHFSQRYYLWFKTTASKKIIDENKLNYLGNTENETKEKIKALLKPESDAEINERELRLPYFNKYPTLRPFSAILFKSLFSDIIYNKDIKSIVKEIVDVEELLKLKDQLFKNKTEIATLSTFVVNYVYNLSHFLAGTKDKFEVNPKLFLDVAKESYIGKLKNKHNLKIYLLTHCIINESKFYSRPIKKHRQVYNEMIKELEQTILSNYFETSLDTKVEFLVCARLLGVKTPLFDTIMSEAKQSLSHLGNFIIDRHNTFSMFKNKSDFITSEHRNILFLMAYSKNEPKYS